MNYSNFLQKYKLNYYDLIVNKIYFPFDKIDTILNDDFSNINNTKELTDYVLNIFEEIIINDYQEKINSPLLWVQKLSNEHKIKAEKFVQKVMGGSDEIQKNKRLEFNDLKDIKIQVESLIKYSGKWREFLQKYEVILKNLSNEQLIVKNKDQLQYLPIIIFALRHLIDDSIPDNNTAVWPIDLWLHRLPKDYFSNFKLFFKKVYNNKEDYIRYLKEKTPTEDMPHYLEKMLINL